MKSTFINPFYLESESNSTWIYNISDLCKYCKAQPDPLFQNPHYFMSHFKTCPKRFHTFGNHSSFALGQPLAFYMNYDNMATPFFKAMKNLSK